MTAELKTGFTTGSCAAAASKAAVAVLLGGPAPAEMDIPLPGGGRIVLPVEYASSAGGAAAAAIKKYSGDDPDATAGVLVMAEAEWRDDGNIFMRAGEGVGTVTKKGLQIPPGEPAINPGPRKMIAAAVKELTGRGVTLTLSIPGGAEIARNTFNPRLGIVGGLSILGTTGIVRPYSHPALKESLKCSLDVAVANGVLRPVFTAGNIGTRAARALLVLGEEQVIEVSNEWGFMLDCAAEKPIEALLAVGHPGKLAKLVSGAWDTHSSRSGSAVPVVARLVKEIAGMDFPDGGTVEGIFEALPETGKRKVGDALAAQIAGAISIRINQKMEPAVVLVDMKGNLIGRQGQFGLWQWKNI